LMTAGADRPPAAQTEYDSLIQEYVRQEKPVIHASQEATSDSEREAILRRDLRPLVRHYAGRFIELAGRHRGEPAALAALTWAATEPEFACPEQDQAIELLTQDFATKDGVANLCKKLVYSPSPRAGSFLRAVWEKNPHPDVKIQG